MGLFSLVLFIMPLWTDAAYDEDVYNAAKEWHHLVKDYTKVHNKDVSFEFANYAASFQDVMGSYGPESLKFLQQVSRKYDPKGLFQKAVKGGYKLPTSGPRAP